MFESSGTLKKLYPRGTRVRLLQSRVKNPGLYGLRVGEAGTVLFVDCDLEDLVVRWDNGAETSLHPGEDRFARI